MRRAQAILNPAPGGCWPTEQQLLLLRAALLEPAKAATAWERWRRVASPETADQGSSRLLPLVYRNLPADALAEDDRRKLTGAYRATWLQNQLLCRQAADALAALHAAGIETMVLKGIALAVACYRDLGVRPMSDIDVLVRPEETDRALAALAASGWSSGADDGPAIGFKAPHARHLHHDAGRALDLHRYTLEQVSSDDPFWAASIEIEVMGVQTRTLAPTDQLLHVVAHGGRWNAIPPVRWIADAELIRRSAGAGLDWPRFVAEARRRRLTARVAPALECLAAAIDFPVPRASIEDIRRIRTTPLERWAQLAATKPVGGGNWLPLVLDDYARRSRLDPSLSLAHYTYEYFGTRNRRRLAGRMARKAAAVTAAQIALRLAPARVPRCAGCGRVMVGLGRSGTPLCGGCARADRPTA